MQQGAAHIQSRHPAPKAEGKALVDDLMVVR